MATFQEKKNLVVVKILVIIEHSIYQLIKKIVQVDYNYYDYDNYKTSHIISHEKAPTRFNGELSTLGGRAGPDEKLFLFELSK